MIEVERSCPLGHVCERVRNGKLERCVAYAEIEGAHPQTGEPMRERKCAVFEWQPILLLEIARTNRGQTQAIESFRNTSAQGFARLAALASPPRPGLEKEID